jgi:hypothetical protein
MTGTLKINESYGMELYFIKAIPIMLKTRYRTDIFCLKYTPKSSIVIQIV